MKIRCQIHSKLNIASFFILLFVFAAGVFFISRDAYSPLWRAIGLVIMLIAFSFYVFAFIFLFRVFDYIIFYSDKIEVCSAFRKKRIVAYEDYVAVVGRYESVIENKKAFIFTPCSLNSVCSRVDTRKFGNVTYLNKNSILYCMYSEKLHAFLMSKHINGNQQNPKSSNDQIDRSRQLCQDPVGYENPEGVRVEKEKNTQIEAKENFPKFKYFADPIKAKSINRSNASCEICGEKTGYIYANAFYAASDIESICPWCIANGAAAEKYGGTFHDFEVEDDNITDEKVKELMERTPGFECMQPGIWPCHCGEICVFIEHVGWSDIVRLGLANELEDDLKKIKEEYVVCNDEDIGNLFLNENSLCGYLFKCIVCGKHRLMVDLD